MVSKGFNGLVSRIQIYVIMVSRERRTQRAALQSLPKEINHGFYWFLKCSLVRREGGEGLTCHGCISGEEKVLGKPRLELFLM